MSAPTTHSADSRQAVPDDLVALYSDDAAIAGLATASYRAGLLAAYVDTYLLGDADRSNLLDAGDTDAALTKAMADAIARVHQAVQLLPCLCSETTGQCVRCRATGQDNLDNTGGPTTKLPTNQIIANVLVDHGVTDVETASHLATQITSALWTARTLVGADPADAHMRDEIEVLRSQITDLREGLIKALALKPDVSDKQIMMLAADYRRYLDNEARMSQELREQLRAVTKPADEDLTERIVRAIAINQAIFPDEDDALEWERIRDDAAAVANSLRPLQEENAQLRAQLRGLTTTHQQSPGVRD